MKVVKENSPNKSIKVFYDGLCPLCSREIQHYQKMRGADAVEWIDINKDKENLQNYGLTFDQVMARFHVLDARGCWHTGAYAFAELWSSLPGMNWLAFILKKFYLLPLLDRIYTVFARYRARKKCKSDVCHY